METSSLKAEGETSTATTNDDQGRGRQGSGSESCRKFSPQEEEALINESNEIKAEANTLFSSQDYDNALSRYDDAIKTCPNYLHYERSVLQSNMAACHLKLEQWQEAIKIATKAIDGLVKLEQQDSALLGSQDEQGEEQKPRQDAESSAPKPSEDKQDKAVEEEIISPGASRSAPAPPKDAEEPKSAVDTRKADILRIRTKALLRRARARSEAGGWQNLTGAEEDYKILSQMPGLGPADTRTVRNQLRTLPPRTKAAQEKEMGEMWGKLRTLGDGILKPFGLSTENFQMVKDENTGGYSMNFTSGDGSSKQA